MGFTQENMMVIMQEPSWSQAVNHGRCQAISHDGCHAIYHDCCHAGNRDCVHCSNHDGYHAINYDSCHANVHICSLFTTVRPFPSLNLITGSSTQTYNSTYTMGKLRLSTKIIFFYLAFQWELSISSNFIAATKGFFVYSVFSRQPVINTIKQLPGKDDNRPCHAS